MSHVTMDQLLDELRKVVNDAEGLLRATAGEAGERTAQARARAEASLDAARATLEAMGQQAGERLRDAGDRANQYVHANPWPAIGMAAAAGLLLGIMLGRRRGPR